MPRTEAEAQALRTTAGRWRVEGIVHERLAADDFRRVEPALNPEVRVAYFLPDRAQVRNPWHLRALRGRCPSRGARLEPFQAVDRLETQGDRIVAVQRPVGPLPAIRWSWRPAPGRATCSASSAYMPPRLR